MTNDRVQPARPSDAPAQEANTRELEPDIITDFSLGGGDKLDLRSSSFNFSSLEDVLLRAREVNGDMLLDLGNGDCELLDELVVDRVLHEDAVRRDADLA